MKIRESGEGGRKNGGDRSRCSSTNEPAKVVVSKAERKGGQILVAPTDKQLLGNRKHPVNTPGAPSFTVTTKGDGRGAQGACALRLDQAVLDWPWARPVTTIARDERIPPYGHHDSNSYLSDANAIVLSELAAKILQGFPETWHFAGKTKKARWSQLGQAMPPGLAEPVARAIVDQMRASAVTTEAA